MRINFFAEFLLRIYPILSEIWGFSSPFSKVKHRKIFMYYTSTVKDIYEDWFQKKIGGLVKKYGNKIQIGIGLIDSGIRGNEDMEKYEDENAKNLVPEELERDLKLCITKGIEEVAIYRLGGLTAGFVGVIKKFIDFEHY